MAPNKRKAPNDSAGNSRERKKAKLSLTRAIPVRTGPSVSDSLTGLPASLDVERFTDARQFEIRAMETALANSKGGSNTRAMQLLPRHLRRRAASHDPRRVPQRLREKAKVESSGTKPRQKLRQPRLARDKRLSRAETFLKRQRDKTWLETHIWHAKRMHMENMWGYRLAITPTEKAFRSSHRAAFQGSILHDASYFAVVQLRGPEAAIGTLLESCCDPQGPSPKAFRFANGSRILETQFYNQAAYPFELLGPISIIWRPQPPTAVLNTTALKQATSKVKPGGKSKKDRKGGPIQDAAKNSDQSPSVESRVVWIIIHPSFYDAAFSALTKAISLQLLAEQRATKPENTPPVTIEITDLRNKLNAFEIMGPKANQVLAGALTPVKQDKRDSFHSFWNDLGRLQTSASSATGMVIGFKVIDPRLNFPPHDTRIKVNTAHHTPLASSAHPSSELASSELWDDLTRDKLSKPRYKKKAIDERRGKNLTPGTKLKLLRQDDRVPCLLVQKSFKGANTNDEGVHGWTLVIPSGWSMAFWPSLIYTGTRVGGQRERQHQLFEAGKCHFPRDSPFTPSYITMVDKEGTMEREKWERTPAAKKPNYTLLGTRSPWIPDWEIVLGLAKPIDAGFIPAQRESLLNAQPWLLCGPQTSGLVNKCLESPQAPGTSLLEAFSALRASRGLQPLEHDANRETFIQGALVRIRIQVVRRGSPENMACLYMLKDEEVKDYVSHTSLQVEENSMEDDTTDADKDAAPTSTNAFPPDRIIGYVTSGNFSLSRGGWHAIGAIPVLKYLQIARQAKRLASRGIVGVRNRHERLLQAAYIELLQE